MEIIKDRQGLQQMTCELWRAPQCVAQDGRTEGISEVQKHAAVKETVTIYSLELEMMNKSCPNASQCTVVMDGAFLVMDVYNGTAVQKLSKHMDTK